MAYHGLAVDADQSSYGRKVVRSHKMYRGCNKEEEVLISSLAALGESLVQPAVFLSGITGLRSPSEDDRNHWDKYLSRSTSGNESCKVCIHSLYEAQNEGITQHYFRRLLTLHTI